ncbi:type VI secretion system membrane subunit TssM [Metapseudomonas lalkuanensis]|uniref:type VI secretion system membrane subunit TssM n=1 Tax=Metapseudomonas lalkuanensis TaxID=2604832 RepID=UPI001CF280A1|nr:type VI secretion system membrane subunit TssM [Pseudomonas lalkuanensis]UCO98903.1 type VI secretion system membrane subunit TssM [Pseudomonas lalkuanensis]
MKDFFKKLGTILRRTWVWSLLLVLALALLVWFAGPLLAIDDHKFWASASARLLSIAVLFLAWGLFIVFTSWRSTHRHKQEEASDDGQERLRREEQISEEQKELRSRFKEALRTLQGSSLYRGRSERWRNDLPWYLMLGPQGSGKTSLLDFSGLEFPINRIDRKLTRDTSGTRYCDWYFADHGVLIDSAGRYLTHPSSDVDCSAWQTLLGLLRKRRRARPLNGVLVNLPVDLLLAGNEPELERLARQVRARLQDINQRLHVDVPVYLVLGKADKLTGFEEFFDHLSREESDQVLGASFRKEQDGTDVSVLRQEFEELLRRLNNQVIMRMHQERDTGRRGRILDFPHQLGRIGEPLCLFVDLAFTGNRYQRASQLRGFYLTSAPHLMQQMDRTTAEVGANLGMHSNTLPSLREGRSRFIHHLFSRVIFPEADLAGLDQRETRRIHWGQRALYATSVVFLALFGLLWAGGFSANHERLEQVRDFGRKLEDQHAALTPQDDARATLKALDDSYAASEVFPPKGDVSLFERGGLYQGEKTTPVVQDAYRRELESQLLPRVARTLEDQIRANLGNRERLLGSLRAYLMLNLPERRAPAFLKDWLGADWSLRYSGDALAQNGLGTHFARLLEQPFVYPLDAPLVAQARQVLRSESLPSVVYRVLREQARSLPDYRFSQRLGPQGALFSGTDYLIPGFYTQRGYQQFFATQGVPLVREILRDNWVLGEGSSLSSQDLSRLMVELQQLYFRDYANLWSEAINRLRLQPIADTARGADLVAGLTAANSPLLQLLAEIRENTRLQGVAESAGDAAALTGNAGGKLGKVAAAAAEQAQDALSKSLPDTARQTMERRFDPLHRLLDDNAGATADLVPAMQALNDLQLQLAALARASQPEQAAFDLARNRMSGQSDALTNLRGAASRLPQPVDGWLALLAGDSWNLVLANAHQYLNQRYQSELFSFYLKAIDKRYPFYPRSKSDVAIADFREFFKVQGVADRFFETYLKPFVSGDPGNYRLRSVDGGSLPVSRGFLEQMGNAQVIRRSFFADNPAEPQVQFKLEPYSIDSSLRRAEFRFGDRQLEYRHGPIVPVAFKWPTDADDGRTSLVLEELGGRRVGLEKNTGPWSLFRLFDQMHTEYHSGRDVLMIKADLAGLRANYLVLAQRSPNPFDLGTLRSFRLPVTL